jgi:hypothetical protein
LFISKSLANKSRKYAHRSVLKMATPFVTSRGCCFDIENRKGGREREREKEGKRKMLKDEEVFWERMGYESRFLENYAGFRTTTAAAAICSGTASHAGLSLFSLASRC